MPPEMTVRNNTETHVYDALIDDEVVGSIIYDQHGSRVVISHTVVDPGRRGQGVATKLVKGALDDLRDRGLTMTNYCGFISSYLATHPEYADLVDPAHPGYPRRA